MLFALAPTYVFVAIALAVGISIIILFSFLFRSEGEALWWLLPKGERKRGPLTLKQLGRLLGEVSQNGLSVRKGDSGEWHKWVTAGIAYPELVQSGLVKERRIKPAAKPSSRAEATPEPSRYFSCPHCKAILQKTSMDLASRQVDGVIFTIQTEEKCPNGPAGVMSFNKQSKQEKCPNCGRRIDRVAIISGTYDVSESEIVSRGGVRSITRRDLRRGPGTHYGSK